MIGKGKRFEQKVIYKLIVYAQSKSGCFHDGDQPPLSVYFINGFYEFTGSYLEPSHIFLLVKHSS